jgi:NADH dehydrogenase
MTFDDMIRILMDVTGHRRPILHIPEGFMRAGAWVMENLPTPLLSRDAVTFVTADNATDIKPLVAEFGIQLTPMRQGLRYLAPSAR